MTTMTGVSTAHSIKEYIETHSVAAFSLSAANGYLNDMRRITFPMPVSSTRKDNEDGRCIKATATYEDGSVLEYKYNTAQSTYKLKVLTH